MSQNQFPKPSRLYHDVDGGNLLNEFACGVVAVEMEMKWSCRAFPRFISKAHRRALNQMNGPVSIFKKPWTVGHAHVYHLRPFGITWSSCAREYVLS